MSTASNNELRLLGAGVPTITFLRGEQWGTERTQELFQGAIWTFRPDGLFTFQPSPAAHVRDDLYPIGGTYASRGNLREFHGSKETDLGADASVDGFLDLRGEDYQIEVLYTVSARKIVKAVQTLSPDISATAHMVRTRVGALQIPTVFRFFIGGSVDGQDFGSLPGTLKLLPRSAADPNPFDVQCMTDSLRNVGALSWLSFVEMEYGLGEVISSVLLGENGVQLTVEKALHPLSPSWSAVSRDEILEGSQGPMRSGTGGIVVPVMAESGRLTLTIQSRQLSGSVQAQGISALQQRSTYEAQLVGQELDAEEKSQDGLLVPEESTEVQLAQFPGVWISEAFLEMRLEQQGTVVMGAYTGRGGGTITGAALGHLLRFSWQDGEKRSGKRGWGFLRLASNGRTLAGLWGEGEQMTSKGIIAELLQRPAPVLVEEQLQQDKIDIKHQGYDLIRQGNYEQALPVLKKALELYREEIQQGGPALDAHLIDDITLQQNLLRCYFELADYQGVPTTPEVASQQTVFYHELLGYLQGAVASYQLFLHRTLLSHTTRSIEELTKSMETLQPWYEKLTEQATRLQQRAGEEKDPHVGRMRALADILGRNCTRVLAARDEVLSLEQRTPGRLASFVQALTSLDEQLEEARQQTMNDIERLKILGVDWPAEEQEFVQSLTFLLTLLPVEIEGRHRLIAQAIKDTEERVPSAWRSAFDLSQWLERWRIRLSTDAAKIDALELGQPFFEKIVAFFVDMEQGVEALLLSERARARAFADLLAARSSGQEGRLGTGGASRLIDQPLTQDKMLQIVQKHQSFVIEYFFTETRLMIWAISSSGDITTFISSASRDEVERMVREFSDLVQVSSYADQKQRRLFEILRWLYGALIVPVEDQLARLSKEEVVTIIPHAQLFLVPFSALLDKRGTYLIEKHVLVYSPAIATLEYTRRNVARMVHLEEPDLLALVNPIDNLPIAEEEFDGIARFYAASQNNAVYVRNEADKAILQQEASKYAVLCFVTHAQAFDESPLDSYLALAPTASDDGHLKVPEIFQLELHTDLVILGACETGRGKITGDGVNGLNRAFLAAGTPTLLMSLWPVGEEETINQLYQFHEFWRKRSLSKAEALRSAQLEALVNHPLQPEIWAGFVLIGEWN